MRRFTNVGQSRLSWTNDGDLDSILYTSRTWIQRTLITAPYFAIAPIFQRTYVRGPAGYVIWGRECMVLIGQACADHPQITSRFSRCARVYDGDSVFDISLGRSLRRCMKRRVCGGRRESFVLQPFTYKFVRGGQRSRPLRPPQLEIWECLVPKSYCRRNGNLTSTIQRRIEFRAWPSLLLCFDHYR